ncbi:hypothetical protein ACN6LM_003875 [Streptomyces sp. SAS_281]|uniref:hypothetical protein n=1 Tax=Streptomyces sp. SAS_281 TaxID=3412744 RepID=UPI00403C2261
MSGSVRPCGDVPPHGLRYARFYPRGWCCDRHTPSALAGRPEPQPGPGWPAGSYLNQLTPEPPAEQEQP